MIVEELVRLLKIERECVSRDCNRDCSVCDIVQERDQLLSMYDSVINIVDKQIPVEPNYIRWGNHGRRAFCKLCGHSVRITSDKYCGNCGQKLKYTKEIV